MYRWADPITALTARADASVALQELFLEAGCGGAAWSAASASPTSWSSRCSSARRDRAAAGLARAGCSVAAQFAGEAGLLGCGGVAGAVLGGFRHDRLRGGPALGRGRAGAGAAGRGGHRPAGGRRVVRPVSGAARERPAARGAPRLSQWPSRVARGVGSHHLVGEGQQDGLELGVGLDRGPAALAAQAGLAEAAERGVRLELVAVHADGA